MHGLIESKDQWSLIINQASTLVKSGMLPQTVRTPEAAVAIMLKGRELNLPPMVSFSNINIIKGKPTLSAELMRALVLRDVPGAVFEPTEWNSESCTILAGRPGRPPIKISFSIRDAQLAKLTGNDNWQKFPAEMLLARATSKAARAVFPDVILGCYTPEEMAPESVKMADDGTLLIEAETTDAKSQDRKSQASGADTGSGPYGAPPPPKQAGIAFDKTNPVLTERVMARLVDRGLSDDERLDVFTRTLEVLDGRTVDATLLEEVISAEIQGRSRTHYEPVEEPA